jgi:hypothetical protein
VRIDQLQNRLKQMDQANENNRFNELDMEREDIDELMCNWKIRQSNIKRFKYEFP